MEQQRKFSFMEQERKRENKDARQNWFVPVGKSDQYNDKEDVVIEFIGERSIWRKDGKEISLEEIQSELGGDWVSAVNKSASLRKAVEESAKPKN